MKIHEKKLSGKCCLEDTIGIWTNFEEDEIIKFLNRTNFYTDLSDGLKPENKITILSYKDLVPYLPRCETIMCMNHDGQNTIVLDSKPHWMWEEEERIEWIVKNVFRVYNRCKRKKTLFTLEDCIKENAFETNKDIISEIYDRIVKSGKKATFTDIRLNFTNKIYRQPLIEEMINVGYTEEQAKTWAYENIKTW